jgi:hypothetical protein
MYYKFKSYPKSRLLAWLKEGKYWVNLGDKEETSTRGRLLQLLPKVEDADLRKDIEETLKKML